MPTTFRFTRALRRAALATTLVALTSCRNPQADAYLSEQIRQLGDELNASRQQEAQMQSELDSLRGVVARQDTLLTKLAGMAGVPR
ncbi:MAG: hypothetical protein JWL95_1015 [Gemmatimonadetes bacterium]|nr:hypothetical protein [Gemmatimonadota bacterium]